MWFFRFRSLGWSFHKHAVLCITPPNSRYGKHLGERMDSAVTAQTKTNGRSRWKNSILLWSLTLFCCILCSTKWLTSCSPYFCSTCWTSWKSWYHYLYRLFKGILLPSFFISFTFFFFIIISSSSLLTLFIFYLSLSIIIYYY